MESQLVKSVVHEGLETAKMLVEAARMEEFVRWQVVDEQRMHATEEWAMVQLAKESRPTGASLGRSQWMHFC